MQLLLWGGLGELPIETGIPAYAGIPAGPLPSYPAAPHRPSRVSGNPERYCLMPPHPWQTTVGFPLTRE